MAQLPFHSPRVCHRKTPDISLSCLVPFGCPVSSIPPTPKDWKYASTGRYGIAVGSSHPASPLLCSHLRLKSSATFSAQFLASSDHALQKQSSQPPAVPLNISPNASKHSHWPPFGASEPAPTPPSLKQNTNVMGVGKFVFNMLQDRLFRRNDSRGRGRQSTHRPQIPSYPFQKWTSKLNLMQLAIQPKTKVVWWL
jgi:hypothetical protein